MPIQEKSSLNDIKLLFHIVSLLFSFCIYDVAIVSTIFILNDFLLINFSQVFILLM
jgi:hypothetical protein